MKKGLKQLWEGASLTALVGDKTILSMDLYRGCRNGSMDGSTGTQRHRRHGSKPLLGLVLRLNALLWPRCELRPAEELKYLNYYYRCLKKHGTV